jgi:signal transduction histidine kinase
MRTARNRSRRKPSTAAASKQRSREIEVFSRALNKSIDLLEAAVARKHARVLAERKQAKEALRELCGRLAKVREEERRSFARELHDSTAQSLAALVMNLSRLNKSLGSLDPQVRNLASDSLTLAEQCSREVRTLSYLLHPPLLDDRGLASAVRWYVEGYSRRSRVRVHLDLPGEVTRLPREIETALFRVVQESLSNVYRHSGSRVARVRLEQGPAELKLEISDEGRRIPSGGVPKLRQGVTGPGVGVAGMRERVVQLGGRFEVHSGQRGTTVRVTLPSAKREA